MKVILFGGSFSPIHQGHISIAKKAQEHISADKVIFIPSFVSFDDKTLISNEDRINMINLAIDCNDNFYLSNFEIQNEKINYTIDTINHFLVEYKNDDIYLLMGSDLLINFKDWKDYEDILNKVKIICFNRNDENIKTLISKYSENIIYIVENKNKHISSSDIKNNFRYEYLDKKVKNYINEHLIFLKDYIKPDFVFNFKDYNTVFSVLDERYKHMMRTSSMAKIIAKNNNLENIDEIYQASLIHDLFKNMDKNIQIQIFKEIYPDKDIISFKVLHGPIAAWFLEKYLLYENKNILRGIKRHTMPYNFDYPEHEISILDKVVYCADKLEHLRTDKDVNNIDKIREMVNIDINKGFDFLYNQLKK